MKTKEFIKRVDILGFKIYKNNYCDGTKYFVIQNSFDVTMCHVAINKLFEMDIRFSEYMSETLVDLIVEYAKTPVEDREEEKKYYLKHRFLTSLLRDMKYSFINYDTKYNDIYLSSNEALDYVKTKFTLKEIEEIKKKFNTDLNDFEIVEVENEN